MKKTDALIPSPLLPLLIISILPFMLPCRADGEFSVLDPHPDKNRTADGRWRVNDPDRPRPPRAEPKAEEELAAAATPPAGAIILFDGSDLSQWREPRWKVENGHVETTPGSGSLITKESFGSIRLHLEWWTFDPPQGKGQNAGNSGVFLMSQYEIQVLDNTDNDTYADGLAGAIYGQKPPDSDPSRPSGHWQYYDIEFRRPIFDEKGKVLRPARMTVDFNGVRVHDGAVIEGRTSHRARKGYEAHAGKLPLGLQDHASIVRYRNIWLTPIDDNDDNDEEAAPAVDGKP